VPAVNRRVRESLKGTQDLATMQVCNWNRSHYGLFMEDVRRHI